MNVRERADCAMNGEKGIYNGFLSGNALKIIACITMLIDHVGWILLPDVLALRMIGRISMPLFAFTFGEGCAYTRSRAKHFALVLLCGVATSLVMSFAMDRIYANILITFSLSCLVIYALDGLKRYAYMRQIRAAVLCAAALLCALGAAVWLCCFSPVYVDYGIAGVLLPACVHLTAFRRPGQEGPTALYNPAVVWLLFTLDLVALSVTLGTVQLFCLFSLPLLFAYSGRRGRYKLKALFYAFYPAHLAVLAGIYLVLHPDYLAALF